MTETLTLTDPLDMHVHLRDGAMLDTTVPLTAARFSGALAMPNLVPPLTSAEEAAAYRERIEERCRGAAFRPYTTLFFHEGLVGAELERARGEVLAVKLYPRRATTHSDDGVDLPLSKRALRVIETMEELGMVLCVHGETAGFVMDREREFVAVYDELSRLFPRLTIVMEHITTREAAELLVRRDNLHATITLHHLMLTLDDVVGGRIRPHNFCMPLPKTPADRDALAELAFAAHPRVMFGSDSAPTRGRTRSRVAGRRVSSRPPWRWRRWPSCSRPREGSTACSRS